jgi:hypothetical protein
MAASVMCGGLAVAGEPVMRAETGAARVEAAKGSLTLQFSGKGSALGTIEGVELVLPFAPDATPVTALSSDWSADGSFRLPAIVSAPDFGQMLLVCQSTAADRQTVRKVGLDGSRKDKVVNLVLTLTPPQAGCDLAPRSGADAERQVSKTVMRPNAPRARAL